MTFKEEIYNHCKEEVENQLTVLQKAIEETRESLGSETKSSAGDKHETGRAMAQLEMEKLGSQHQNVIKLKRILSQLKPEAIHTSIKAGSLVGTKNSTYFLSIGLGKLEVRGKEIYAISPASPVAQLLLSKKVGMSFSFNQKEEVITSCS